MLSFEIDTGDLLELMDELGASDKQLYQSFNRALMRTAATLRKMSSKGLKSELQLRNAKAIRKRLRTINLKHSKYLNEIMLWYGTNDLPISAFKGTPKKSGAGASFRERDYKGAFIAKGRDRKRTIFKRRGNGRLPIEEQTVAVKDRMDVYLEDQVFDQLEDIFFRHFRADLRARTIYGVGRN